MILSSSCIVFCKFCIFYLLNFIVLGLGSSIIIVECEIIMNQYFRLKLPILSQISQCVSIIGFLIAPVLLGHYILTTSINHVLLWYQAIILQGLVVALVFRTPLYLKSKKPKPYQFVLVSQFFFLLKII